jgi:hypothetical protein
MTRVIAIRRKLPLIIAIAICVAGTGAVIIKQIDQTDLSYSLYYHVFGSLVYPVFYTLALISIVGLSRILLIANRFIRITEGKLRIGFSRPIMKEEVASIEIVARRLNVALMDNRIISTNSTFLIPTGQELLGKLSAWRSASEAEV